MLNTEKFVVYVGNVTDGIHDCIGTFKTKKDAQEYINEEPEYSRFDMHIMGLAEPSFNNENLNNIQLKVTVNGIVFYTDSNTINENFSDDSESHNGIMAVYGWLCAFNKNGITRLYFENEYCKIEMLTMPDGEIIKQMS